MPSTHLKGNCYVSKFLFPDCRVGIRGYLQSIFSTGIYRGDCSIVGNVGIGFDVTKIGFGQFYEGFVFDARTGNDYPVGFV
jgi:hypothetical protein